MSKGFKALSRVREQSSLTTQRKQEPLISAGFKAALFFGILFLAFGCSRQKSEPMLEYMPNMAHSPAVKAQERPMFLPVVGTVPRDWEAYPYGVGDTLQAAAELVNLLPATLDILQAGQKSFNTLCIVCHGAKGDGKGYIIPKFPQPPSLLTDRVRNWPDGRIFHVISRGQQTMPNYAFQLDPAQRWAVVNYVRVLQRAARPTAADLTLMRKLGIDFSADEPDTGTVKLWPER